MFGIIIKISFIAGSTFEGNQVVKLLNSVAYLRSLLNENTYESGNLDLNSYYMGLEFCEAFEQLNLIRKKCFGYDLDPTYETNIDAFILSIKNLSDEDDADKLNFTWKFHDIFLHLRQFCNKYQTGLGLYSEVNIWPK